jgi:hypothetical protein
MRIAWLRLAVVVGATLLGMGVGARRSHACDCATPGSPTASAEAAVAVFEGKATLTSNRASDGVFGGLVEYRVDVLRRWKGDIPATVSIWTPVNSAACGVELEQGVPYVIYASAREGRLSVMLCSRTAPTSLRADDVTELGPSSPAVAGGTLGVVTGEGGCSFAARPARPAPVIASIVLFLCGLARRRTFPVRS